MSPSNVGHLGTWSLLLSGNNVILSNGIDEKELKRESIYDLVFETYHFGKCSNCLMLNM